MTVSRPFATLIFLVASAFAATAQDNPIVQRMTAFATAYNAGDAAAIGQFYAPDGALLPPQAKALVGREAIAGHYTAAFAQGVGNLRFKVVEIRQHGPASVVEIGETAVDAGGRTILGRYLHVWTLSDNQWWLSRDMYHVLGTQ